MNSIISPVESPAAKITPGIIIKDPVAEYWFSQVILRLRREVSWCWYQRMQQPGIEGVLPPVTDAAVENLDLVRYAAQKQQFFEHDDAARFLSQQIELLQLPETSQSRWGWVSSQLELNTAEQFVLALGLALQIDAGLAPIFATCMNDLSRPFPTMALAQRLWNEPVDIIACADPNHALFRYGLLRNINDGADGLFWHRPLNMPSMVAQQLLDPDAEMPEGLQLIKNIQERELLDKEKLIIARLKSEQAHMQIVPMLGRMNVAYEDWAYTINKNAGRPVVSIPEHLLQDKYQLQELASVCWMHGKDIVLPDEWFNSQNSNERSELLLATSEIPLRWYIPINDSALQKYLPEKLLTPFLEIKELGFNERVELFKKHLSKKANKIEEAVEECARRFRFQEKMVERVARTFNDGLIPLTAESLHIACANEATIEMGNLAQHVVPRFNKSELVLPEEKYALFKDIIHAMQALTVVHYHWGTARVWNESGLSVLFYGPPGTGKTMSAEVLANELDLPMYRVDLSQAVNKYIGETEKNLKRIFDAAEMSDCILFFDEADALFGKRTDVKDAHDRFANIEISYLLERMEQFKGLAILATNRRKDVDEAFMRRLRYVIEFPVPDFEERLRIWQLVFPANVDISDLDLRFLAKQFQLSGGHIRSIAFNACLRAADPLDPTAPEKITMLDVVKSVKHELEKMDRSSSEELFGPYSHLFNENSKS